MTKCLLRSTSSRQKSAFFLCKGPCQFAPEYNRSPRTRTGAPMITRLATTVVDRQRKRPVSDRCTQVQELKTLSPACFPNIQRKVRQFSWPKTLKKLPHLRMKASHVYGFVVFYRPIRKAHSGRFDSILGVKLDNDITPQSLSIMFSLFCTFTHERRIAVRSTQVSQIHQSAVRCGSTTPGADSARRKRKIDSSWAEQVLQCHQKAEPAPFEGRLHTRALGASHTVIHQAKLPWLVLHFRGDYGGLSEEPIERVKYAHPPLSHTDRTRLRLSDEVASRRHDTRLVHSPLAIYWPRPNWVAEDGEDGCPLSPRHSGC